MSDHTYNYDEQEPFAAAEFADTQGGTLHFRHLLPENGGFLRVAGSLDEHVAQLSSVLGNADAGRAELSRFVATFIAGASR